MRAGRLQSLILIGPALGWLALFLVIPCGLVLAYSFLTRGIYGGIVYEATIENFRLAGDPLYARIFLDSARIAGITTLLALLVAYPAAYSISRAPSRHQSMLLFLAVLPFWSNYLIRTYAWIVLLNREGLVNQALIWAGYTGQPVNMLYGEGAVVVGLLYNYLPFVILSVYSSIARLDPELWEASRDLGGTPTDTFLRVILPLTAPGIAAGAVFVFILSIGNFITPDLLGGGRVMMVGNLIYDQFLTARDWPFGSALSFALIGIMLVLLFAQAMATRRVQGDRHA